MTASTERPWAEIAKRAQMAGGPDRILDADIDCLSRFRNLRPARPDDFEGRFGYHPGNIKTEHGFLQARYNSGSLDAVLTSLWEKLPGAMWSVCSMEDGPFAQVIRPMGAAGYIGGLTEARGSTPELALLAAFALAMDAQPLPADEGGQS